MKNYPCKRVLLQLVFLPIFLKVILSFRELSNNTGICPSGQIKSGHYKTQSF